MALHYQKRRCMTMPRKVKNINIEIGARLKEKRLEKKLSRDELAALSGYSANFIQEVERGRSGLSSESIRTFSSVLKIPADMLLFGDVPAEFAYIIRELKTVPPEKIDHVIKIIEEAIKCSQ